VRKLLVIGGGITGLSAAYLATRNGYEVTVLEASPKLGGLLQTFPVGGNHLEFYYHHFFTHDAELRWLLRELEIENRLEFFDATMGVFRNGTIYPFNGLMDLLRFRPLHVPDKIRFALSSLYLGKFADWKKYEKISATSWFRRHAGAKTTESLWQPLLNIKFGPYADQVPAAWMVGRLRQRMNSRRHGDEKLGYLRGSLKTLLDALESTLRKNKVALLTNAKAQHFVFENKRIKRVETTQGSFEADDILLTIPTPQIIPLLQSHFPDYASTLSQINYFGAVCTILELSRPLSSIYWLNIADPGHPFGGIIEHTNLIPPSEYNGVHIVYLSRYFAATDPLAKASESEIQKLMLEALKKVFPDFSEKIVRRIHIFRTSTAAVVCDINFSHKIPHCRTPMENLFLAGMTHVYPDERSCNNSIRVAAEACRVMGMNTSFVPKCASLSGQIGMD
jgi:protoporphyrinogen oxidase